MHSVAQVHFCRRYFGFLILGILPVVVAGHRAMAQSNNPAPVKAKPAASPTPAATGEVGYPTLRQEILKRYAQDQEVRNAMIESGVLHPDPAIMVRMKTIDAANQSRMQAVIKHYGWPGTKLVGRDASHQAFILVQHAEFEFQKQVLPLVEKAYKSGDLDGQDYALLLDRVRIREDKPQVYGTQAKAFQEWKGTEPVLEPIEDEATVDQRRAAVGLSSLAEYRALLKSLYFPQAQPATPAEAASPTPAASGTGKP